MTRQLTDNDLERFEKFIENGIRVKLENHKGSKWFGITKQQEKNHKKYLKDARGLLGRIKAERREIDLEDYKE